jgi:hypothetical protein
MTPTVAFLGGLFLIWIVASGRAQKIWSDVTGQSPSGSTNAPGISPGSGTTGAAPGGSGVTGIPPGARDPYNPIQTTG